GYSDPDLLRPGPAGVRARPVRRRQGLKVAGAIAATDRVDPRGLLMLAFDGFELPDAMSERLRSAPAAGISLFRYLNVRSAGQLRELTDAVQRAAAAPVLRPAAAPLLVAADQEGGQFLALGDDATPFAGNMALGGAGRGHVRLARRAAGPGSRPRAVGWCGARAIPRRDRRGRRPGDVRPRCVDGAHGRRKPSGDPVPGGHARPAPRRVGLRWP